jgi:hypothetical protein
VINKVCKHKQNPYFAPLQSYKLNEPNRNFCFLPKVMFHSSFATLPQSEIENEFAFLYDVSQFCTYRARRSYPKFS